MTTMDPNDNNNFGREMDGRMNGKDNPNSNNNGQGGNNRQNGGRNGENGEMDIIGDSRDQGMVLVMFMLGLASW
eukprot:CAMPEP_0113301970 /NCGR_PEP_ID=MMETSP0010_2-20120614/2973_1 /TAXON_ID=216773 ORGANISM="Corethron hystrix, Strain 308" /NCGR_SAMPLE_ID=MMETSP0010_2 /ASSEMBLY_ACC=CAM_ASM_000155 /LENGTH=73 /DNA_ID=CAMNT_0000155673 /DNA_START=200 /DNA_END=418 /DNA_ORIENTATION=- /assembly_acc=CAM_ASM_000155